MIFHGVSRFFASVENQFENVWVVFSPHPGYDE